MKRISLWSLYVDDQDAAIDFYREKLGFEVVEDRCFVPQRWVTLRLSDDDVVSITLKLATTEQERTLVGRQASASPLFAIVTDDCMGEYERMRSAGVKFHGE